MLPVVTLEQLFPDNDAATLAELRVVADVSITQLPRGDGSNDGDDPMRRVGAAVSACTERIGIRPVVYKAIDAVYAAALVRQGCTVLYAPDGGELADYGFVFVPKP